MSDVRKAVWLPGRFANIRPTRLRLVTQVLCFQPRHLVADGTKVMRKLCSEPQNGWWFAGITCVFVCIFLVLQRKCGAMCCSCRQGCAWACKRSCLACVRSMRSVAASPPADG